MCHKKQDVVPAENRKVAYYILLRGKRSLLINFHVAMTKMSELVVTLICQSNILITEKDKL
jgi:hypothetical protein